MKVFIAGIDGYLGWSLAQYLTARGHEATGIDLLVRRKWVEEVGGEYGLDVQIRHYENPRVEKEEHYYNPDRNHLIDPGYKPSHDMKAEVRILIGDLLTYKERIRAYQHILIPDIRWDGTRRRSEVMDDVAETR